MKSLEKKRAAMNPRLDNMDRRIGRMEKRIEPVEAYAMKRGWNQFPEALLASRLAARKQEKPPPLVLFAKAERVRVSVAS
jgi:hypothetical protein